MGCLALWLSLGAKWRFTASRYVQYCMQTFARLRSAAPPLVGTVHIRALPS